MLVSGMCLPSARTRIQDGPVRCQARSSRALFKGAVRWTDHPGYGRSRARGDDEGGGVWLPDWVGLIHAVLDGEVALGGPVLVEHPVEEDIGDLGSVVGHRHPHEVVDRP